MIEKLILNILSVNATTGVSANLLDSEGEGVRVYHNRIRQGHGKNAVVFNVLSTAPSYAKKGREAYDEVTVDFAIYHENDFEAATIANNNRTLLSGWAGTYDGQRWNYTVLESEVDGFIDAQDLPNKSQTFKFFKAI